jgi:hypothetical protein
MNNPAAGRIARADQKAQISRAQTKQAVYCRRVSKATQNERPPRVQPRSQVPVRGFLMHYGTEVLIVERKLP